MARAHASFVLRYWRLDAAEQRITVEHIQSGEWTRVTSLAAALAWLAANWGDLTVEPLVGADRDGALPDAEEEGGDDG